MSSRWMQWEPKNGEFSPGTGYEPTKPTEPDPDIRSVGFVGSIPTKVHNLEAKKSEIHDETDQESGKSWDAWMAEQRIRIFAEAVIARKLVAAGSHLDPERAASCVTPFQRAFFDQLAELPAGTKSELLDLARGRGILQEAALAYWLSHKADKDGPPVEQAELILTPRPSCRAHLPLPCRQNLNHDRKE